MPVQFNVSMTRDAIYKCPPENLTVREELNGRQDKPDVEGLIADILKHGQIQPVVVRNDGGDAVLVAGFSRWRAISEINLRGLTEKPMLIKCTNINAKEQGAFVYNISENRMRNETTPIDDAHNIQKLFNWTWDEKDVAQVYFPTAKSEAEIAKAVKWVRERVDLIRLTPEAEQAMKDGRLSESAANAIAKLTAAQQKAKLKAKPQGKITAKDIKTPKPPKVKAPKLDAELTSRLTALFETADYENYDEAKTVWILVNAESLAALKNYVLPE